MQDETTRSAGPFNDSRDYNFDVCGLQVVGCSVGLESGLRLHEFNFLSDRPSRFPVNFPGSAIWAGIVLDGHISLQLPDLGKHTLEAGQWFLGKVEDVVMHNEVNSFSRVLCFSFCGCVMKRLVELADAALQDNLSLFCSKDQLCPTFLQGSADDDLCTLSQSLQIEDCKTLDDKLQVEYRTRNWMSTFFKQRELLAAPQHAFGTPLTVHS